MSLRIYHSRVCRVPNSAYIIYTAQRSPEMTYIFFWFWFHCVYTPPGIFSVLLIYCKFQRRTNVFPHPTSPGTPFAFLLDRTSEAFHYASVCVCVRVRAWWADNLKGCFILPDVLDVLFWTYLNSPYVTRQQWEQLGESHVFRLIFLFAKYQTGPSAAFILNF
jgi:hypothetical protein